MQAFVIRALATFCLLTFATACDAEALLSTPTEPAGQVTHGGYESAEVVRIVDGDTIIVWLDGREERLRYVGIDTPESVTPEQAVECFGVEAADENARLVEGRTVYLEADVEERDRFGRLLRYVYIEERDGTLTMVNRLLVEGGYAEAGNFPPNVRYRDDLFAAEREAQDRDLGLWGTC